MKFKKGDTVIVIAGKDKGKQGEITKVLPKENKVEVEGVNVAKRHLAARGQTANTDRKSTRLNSSHSQQSRMPSSA